MAKHAANLPLQSQLMFPMLDVIARAGGSLRPGELYDRLAAAFDLSENERTATAPAGGRTYNVWERHVRWTRQTAVLRGLIAKDTRGLWELTDHARTNLRNARPGTIVTVLETDRGVLLWARAEDAIAVIERNSVALMFCSPPYPLTKPRAYGNLPTQQWLDWMLRNCSLWRELLTSDGSLMLNLGTVWKSGEPVVNDYIERLTIALQDELSLHYLQRLEWYNRTKLAQPTQWVGVQRVRVRPATEAVLWFGTQPQVKADNRRVLRPYGPRMQRILRDGETPRHQPGGNSVRARSYRTDHGGSIPSNVLEFTPLGNDPYVRACRAAGLQPHPARFPRALAEFVINLTTEPDDIVADLMVGSGTTAEAAERLGRRWICADQSLTYLQTAALRFAAPRLLTAS